MLENIALTIALLLQVVAAWIFIRWLQNPMVKDGVLAIAAIFFLISIGIIEGLVT